MKKHHTFALVHICLVLLAAVASENFDLASGSPIFKAVAGFFIGSYMSIGWEFAKLCFVSLRRGAVPQFDSNRLANAGIISVFGVIALGALFGWWASWEGTTGIWFGLGVFVAANLGTYGVAPLFAEFRPPAQREAVSPSPILPP